ncbi:MAG: VacB/RNase II family 3'-5' exoribonuclease [Elusimicrobia bacterium]|nr:VacB/RNase II family 3'-5' exoribonuclease [Candidatus Liberimonas magnetica]
MKQHWKRRNRHQGDHRHHGAGKKEETREGVIQHHGRFAFLLTETEGGQDVFLCGRGLGLAMDGDRVLARVRREYDGRLSGEIIKVLKRAHTSIVGILKKFPHGWGVFPEKGNASPAQVLSFAHRITPIAGAFAVLEVTRWPTDREGAAGTVTEVLGEPDDLRARITSLLRESGISEYFPKEVLAQSGALPDRLEPPAWHGREELFHLPIVTIDGADAKDFDDAISIEPLSDGMVCLGVHIADVAHYVKTGSAVDKEAYLRGTSVYLPDRVVPMLPLSLSNNLCSLVPNRERLTVSMFMDIDPEGKVTKRRLANTVIRSCRRFTYDEVQVLLDGGKLYDVPAAAAQAVLRMGCLADVLYDTRIKRGALDFNIPEYKVEMDAKGKPLRVALRPRLKSHRLIEEFMLLANESVATELMAAKIPFLHRRHDDPDPAKIKALSKALGDLGLSAGHVLGGNIHKALQDVLRQAEAHPLTYIINSLMVRSMQQAVYAPESKGHFGIAAIAYAHFTSPIRRYPDLMAHRAVKALLSGGTPYVGAEGSFDNVTSRHGGIQQGAKGVSLAEAGEHCSERERAAADAEHKAVDIMRAELFKGHIGEVMDGTVTTIIDTGSFVLCGNTGAEGMLRITNLAPGTKVKVIIDAVDTIDGKIDLSLAQKPQMPPHWRITHRKRK